MKTVFRRPVRWLYPLSGLLLFAAWPMSPLTPLIWVAWVPLLQLDKEMTNGARFFWAAWLNLFFWNLTTTWWIWNASPAGAAGAIIANSLLMCFPLMGMRLARKAAGDLAGYLAFILFWITFEYIHHNWELSWPWLTLGNVFATRPGWIQWYQYTGTTGGSLWILVVNVLISAALRLPELCGRRLAHLSWLAALVLPLLASRIVEGRLRPAKPVPGNMVVVQPNVEPYTEKFNTPPEQLVASMLELSAAAADSNTRLLVWPETAVPAQLWEHQIQENPVFQPVRTFLKQHPGMLLVTGIDSYRFLGTDHPGRFSVRQMNDGSYYEAFNTALGMDSSGVPQLYHKAKLVPGVESLPSWLGFMGSIFNGFGGISGSLGRSDSAVVFRTAGNPVKAAPIICYESIYSNYVTEYVRSGANVLTIITNDGWWGETPGHLQHMNMARLRAVETRLPVARSANTGISCFIDPFGNILQQQGWNVKNTLKMPLSAPERQTFYVRHGDWISRICQPAAIALLLWVLWLSFRWKRKNHKQTE